MNTGQRARPKKTTRRGQTGSANGGVDRDALRRMYHFMRLMREFENTILRLYHQGKIVGGAYSGNGNEATAVGSAFTLADHDYLFPMHRDMGAHFVKGQTVRNLMLQHLARTGSLTEGRDGTGHYTDPELRIYGNISHLGAMLPVACGVALAVRMKKEKSVVMTYIGDGGSNIGEVHEALAMASAMRLPLILIIENNQYAYSTPVAKQSLVEKLSTRAAGYGIPGVTIDGTDVLAVHGACAAAVERARRGGGPTIIESVTMRMHGHAAHDNAWYVPKKLIAGWKKKDPVERFERLLLRRGVLTTAGIREMEAGINAEIAAAVDESLALSYPAPGDHTAGVYAAGEEE